MLDNTESISLHGRLIGNIVEYWAKKSLFEKNDQSIRNELSNLLKSKLNFKTQITWNQSPELIDKQSAAGLVAFIDEDDNVRVINFTTMATGTVTNEF